MDICISIFMDVLHLNQSVSSDQLVVISWYFQDMYDFQILPFDFNSQIINKKIPQFSNQSIELRNIRSVN